MAEKILSVVIPTYNMERYLDRCLSSLIVDDVRMSLVEILVVNDGSGDRSSEIAHGYEARYPESFRVIDKENGNYGSCVNRGLADAKGKYIKILDADDTFETDNFPSFIDLLSSTVADCVISDMKMVKEDGETVDLCNFDLPCDRSVFPISSVLNVADKMWMHCVCYRTERIRAIGYRQSEGISYTDQEWIGLPLAVSSSFVYFPSVLYLYLVGRSGQTVDTTVWGKNFSHEIEGALVMIRERASCGGICSPEGLEYFDLRIKKRINTIYYNYFWLFSGMANNDKMAQLDKSLCGYDRNLYDELGDSITLFNFYHILSNWRKLGYEPSWFMLSMKKIFRLKNRHVGRYYP